jgi:hypothetical protein
MELDELKIQLQQKLNTADTQKSDADISMLLTKKTKSIVDKLKRNLLLEIVFSVVFIIAFGYVALFAKHPSFKIYFTVFTIVMFIFLCVQYFLLQKINRLSNTILPIKQNLITIHSTIKEFVKRCFQFTMALIPICTLLSGYLGYQDGKNGETIEAFDTFINVFSSHKSVLIFLSIYLVVFSIGMYYFTKWYLNKLYRKYLVQLQVCINDFED